MKIPVPSIAVRQYLYGLATPVLAVLLSYRVIDPTGVPLWLAVVGAGLGLTASGTAFAAITKQRKTRRRAKPVTTVDPAP